MEGFRRVIGELQALGLEAQSIDPDVVEGFCRDLRAIAGIGGRCLHAGNFDRCEPAIRDRLKWGASLTPDEVASLRQRHADYRARMDELFAAHQLILMPSHSGGAPGGRGRPQPDAQPSAALHCAVQPGRRARNCHPLRPRRHAIGCCARFRRAAAGAGRTNRRTQKNHFRSLNDLANEAILVGCLRRQNGNSQIVESEKENK